MSTRGGWRVALRLARREAVRRKGQTLLMLLLIALPVLAVTAAAIVWRTQDVSSVESIQRRMGAAAAVVEDSGSSVVYQAGDPDERVELQRGGRAHAAHRARPARRARRRAPDRALPAGLARLRDRQGPRGRERRRHRPRQPAHRRPLRARRRGEESRAGGGARQPGGRRARAGHRRAG
ncbi:hypothetical protein [Nocardioides convexus]|uniref:hypothetical protein n=1 Tax=Nocardioides convexus TaxID=2712224 RepID=UPI003101A11F